VGAVAEAARRARAGLTPADRARYDALAGKAPASSGPQAVGGPGAGLPGVVARALACGAPVDAVEALADLWTGLTRRDRSQVASPLGDGRPGPVLLGGVPARQADGTTCGSTALAMLAAAGDPLLALWLVTGHVVPGHRPPELRAPAAAAPAAEDPAARFAALQRAVKRLSNRRGLGPLPWPAALGTPPWGAARAARFPGVRFTHVLVDDTDPGPTAAVLDRADAALAAGVPVPLFTGGDLGSGVLTAVPRHVVLLVPAGDRDTGPDRAPYAVFEPGRGRVHRATRAELVQPGGARAALGGWSHVCWAVLPG
jgi:hypothetical protein